MGSFSYNHKNDFIFNEIFFFWKISIEMKKINAKKDFNIKKINLNFCWKFSVAKNTLLRKYFLIFFLENFTESLFFFFFYFYSILFYNIHILKYFLLTSILEWCTKFTPWNFENWKSWHFQNVKKFVWTTAIKIVKKMFLESWKMH